METESKSKNGKKGFPFLIMYVIALLIAVIARIGIMVMGNSGILVFNYRPATTPLSSEAPLLDQICGVLSGGTFIAFMFVAGLVLALAAASVLVYVRFCGRTSGGRGGVGGAFLWGLIAAVVSLICLVIVAGGLFTPVQTSQMASKMAIDGMMMLVALLFLLAISTLIAAASLVMDACVATAKDDRAAAIKMFVAVIICGAIVCALTVFTFAPLTAMALDAGALALRFGIDLVVNVVIMFAGNALVARTAHKPAAEAVA